MAFVFRRLALALALLVLLPSPGRADPLALDGGWLNSSLTFGGASFQDDGYDVNGLLVYGTDIAPCPCPDDVFFSAAGGSFVSKTSIAGHTVWHYTGGTFSVRFENEVDPFFTAPITGLDIDLFGTIEPGAGVSAVYQLGPGLFNAAFATLHGVPAHTGTGQMYESLIVFEGNAQSEEIHADDGGGNLFIDAPAAVPAPSLSVLLGLGVAAFVRSRRRT